MRFLSDPVLKLLGWSTGAFAAAQAIRLVNNVLLARILAPELFGIMLIINTLRTGIELTSDVGFGQNIISNKDGAQRSFYSTAWTIQILRGVILCLIFAAASTSIAHFYGHPSISTVLLASSLIFLFSGFNSMGPALLQKKLELKRISIFEGDSIAVLSLVVHVGFALLSPTIWVFGLRWNFSQAPLRWREPINLFPDFVINS